MIISNDTLNERRRYKDKIESTHNEREKLIYEAAMEYSSDVRKKKTEMLQNLLEDTMLMINEKKKAKRLNLILLAVIVIMTGGMLFWLIYNNLSVKGL